MASLYRTIPSARVLLFASAIVGQCASGCVSAEVEFDDVRVAKEGLEFPGAVEMEAQLKAEVPDASIERSMLGEVETSLTEAELPESIANSLSLIDVNAAYALPPQRFSYAGGVESIPDELAASFELHEIVVKPHAMGQPLTFIQRLLLTSSNPNVAHGHPQVVFDYDRASARADGAHAIHIPIQDNARSLDRSALTNSTYELAVWANLNDLPTSAWAVDVALTLSGRVSVKY